LHRQKHSPGACSGLDLFSRSKYSTLQDKYIEPLAAIKQKYPGLAGTMSSRFYDENKFFSKQLAYGKFDTTDAVSSELLPAYKEYLDYFLDTIKAATPETDPAKIAEIRALQAEYDQYSAERDPAVGLFSSYFGPEWAERFTHEFLFEDSEPVVKEKAAKVGEEKKE